MELYNASGVLKTGEIRIAKPISALLIRTEKPFSALTNETITIFIERASGSNVEIATSINLRDFILLSIYGTSAVYGDLLFNTIALCELTPLGAINLAENEAVKFKLDNLISTDKWVINGIEEPATTAISLRYDRKVALAGESVRSFDSSAYMAVCVTNFANIQQIQMQFDNGQICKYDQAEFIALSVDADPIQFVGSSDAYDVNKIAIPLTGVVRFEILKTESQVVQLTFKTVK